MSVWPQSASILFHFDYFFLYVRTDWGFKIEYFFHTFFYDYVHHIIVFWAIR